MAGTGFRIGRGNRLERIENQAAAFAAKEFLVGVLQKLLKDVRQDAHAAAAALAVAGLRERDAVVAFGDARIEFAQILGNGTQGAFALGEGRVQSFLFYGLQRFDFLALRGDGLLRFLERGFRGFDAALGIFSSHHDFELAVFGLGDFRFGIGDFVLQGFVGLVGFYRAALFAIFLCAVLPLLDVQLEFLALGEAVGVGFAGDGDG